MRFKPHKNLFLSKLYNFEQCFVVISTTNNDWPELTPDFDASTNPNVFDPIATATSIIVLASQLYPREFKWAEFDRIDMLYGHSQLRVFSAQGKPANYLPPLWLKDVIKFNQFRQRFLIY